MLDIVNQLLTRHSPFANFFGLWLLNTETSYRHSCSEFSGKGGKTKIPKEKLRVSYSVALIMALLKAMSENRQLKDLPQAEFGRVPEKFLLTVRTKSLNENFVYLKR